MLPLRAHSDYVYVLILQVAGINLDHDDAIVHMSTSDSATAIMTKKNRIFVCTDFTVKSIRYIYVHVRSCFLKQCQ